MSVWRNPDAPNWPPVRNPFEIGAGLFYIGVGFLGVIGQQSSAVTETLRPPLVGIWLLGAALSGIAIVAAGAIVHRDFPTSMLLERIGLKGIFLFSGFLLTLMLIQGRITFVGIILLLIYIVASAVRHRQVTKVVRWMKHISEVGLEPTELLWKAIEEVEPEPDPPGEPSRA